MAKPKSSARTAPAARSRQGRTPRLSASIVAAILLVGCVWLVYGGALHCPFIFDDTASVPDNPSIVSLWPLWGDSDHPGPLNPLGDITTSGRPLINLSFAFNYHFARLDPAGYRRFNIVVHALSALLLMAIVNRVLGLQYFEGRFERVKGRLALAVALLWAVHPLQTETVVYITQRTELLMGLFYLATIYGSLRYWNAVTPAARTTWLVFSTLTCLAGAACKEVMVTAPVVVLLLERTFISPGAPGFRRAIVKSWPLYVGLLSSWGLLIWLNADAPRSQSAGFHLGVPAYAWWFTQTKVLWLYLKLAIWPWPLTIHYHIPYLTAFSAAWPWLLGAAALAIATLMLFWRRSPIGFVGACLFLILSPTFVVPIVTEIAAERRMYLPLAPLVALAAVAGYQLVRWSGSSRETAENRTLHLRQSVTFAAAVFVLALVFSLLSIRRLADYHDAATLWQDALALNPDDSEAHVNFAALLDDRAQWQQAIDQSQQAVRLDPHNSRAHVNLGIALASTGQLQSAVEQFQEAIRWKPDNAEAHNNLGNALFNLGQEEQAVDEFRQALRLKPAFTDACSNLGIVLAHAGQWQAAIQCFERATRFRPDDAELHNNFGAILANSGHPQEAIAHYRQALQLAPGSFELHFNLAIALAKIGQTQEAIDSYRKALQLRPDYVDGWRELAIAYAAAHDSANARSAGEKALQLARMQGRKELVVQIETWLHAFVSNQSGGQQAP